MNEFVEKCNRIFSATTEHYHKFDNIDAVPENPYQPGTIEDVLFRKNWIDAAQWHMEDIIRDPEIEPVAALALKRRIDKSNQDRTDLVEDIDTYFRDLYKDVKPSADATINTESPAWVIPFLNYHNLLVLIKLLFLPLFISPLFRLMTIRKIIFYITVKNEIAV